MIIIKANHIDSVWVDKIPDDVVTRMSIHGWFEVQGIETHADREHPQVLMTSVHSRKATVGGSYIAVDDIYLNRREVYPKIGDRFFMRVTCGPLQDGSKLIAAYKDTGKGMMCIEFISNRAPDNWGEKSGDPLEFLFEMTGDAT